VFRPKTELGRCSKTSSSSGTTRQQKPPRLACLQPRTRPQIKWRAPIQPTHMRIGTTHPHRVPGPQTYLGRRNKNNPIGMRRYPTGKSRLDLRVVTNPHISIKHPTHVGVGAIQHAQWVLRPQTELGRCSKTSSSSGTTRRQKPPRLACAQPRTRPQIKWRAPIHPTHMQIVATQSAQGTRSSNLSGPSH